MFEAKVSRNVLVDVHEERRTAKNLFAILDSDENTVFTRLLRSCFTDCGENLNVMKLKKV